MLSYSLEAEFLTNGTQRYNQTSINRTPVHSQRFWRLSGEVAVRNETIWKPQDFALPGVRLWKRREMFHTHNFSCFLAIAISFLDNYPNLFLHFIADAFRKIVKTC